MRTRMYTIEVKGRKLAKVPASSAEIAALRFSEKCGKKSGLGYVRCVLVLDGDLATIDHALVATDGGEIFATLRG